MHVPHVGYIMPLWAMARLHWQDKVRVITKINKTNGRFLYGFSSLLTLNVLLMLADKEQGLDTQFITIRSKATDLTNTGGGGN